MRKDIFSSEKKKRIRLPIYVYLSYLLVTTLIFIGVTFSKYITSTNVSDSARVVAFGNLEIIEKDKPVNFIITPGVNIVKNPQVSFGTDYLSEMAAYVFVKVDAAGWKYNNGIYQIVRESENKLLLKWSVDENWTPLAGNQVFYRVVPVKGSIVSMPVIAGGKITVSPHLYASEYAELNAATKSITFKAYAVQAHGFDSAQAAYNSVNGK